MIFTNKERYALHLKGALHIGSRKAYTYLGNLNSNALSASLQVQCSSSEAEK
jgi:hypothetical protein